MSSVASSASRAAPARSARSACTIERRASELRPWSGASTRVNCGEKRKGISSGTESARPSPKAQPKSIPTSDPQRCDMRKLSQWRSPMPSTYDATVSAASERANCARVATNDSGLRVAKKKEYMSKEE